MASLAIITDSPRNRNLQIKAKYSGDWVWELGGEMGSYRVRSVRSCKKKKEWWGESAVWLESEAGEDRMD